MKIFINKEKYYNNPCPKITKEMWDWFYTSLWASYIQFTNNYIKEFHTMHIRINQAYKGCNQIHFYITLNKGYKDEFEFHKLWSGKDPYTDFIKPSRYMWMFEFTNYGNVKFNTNKHMIRAENEIKTLKLKEKSARATKRLVNEYKHYLKLKEKFGHYKIYEYE